MAIGLPHWADSSSAEATSSDDSEPPPGIQRNCLYRDPLKTPTKRHKLQRVESTPRRERALRRDFLRQRSEVGKGNRSVDSNDNGSGQPNALGLERGLFGDPDPFNMSNQQGKWREDQVLVVCPGSQTTMAQLGCSELTPPAHRIPTRMFKDEDSDEYRPFYTYKRKKTAKTEKSEKAETTAPADGANDEDEWEYIEDRDSVEDAIYPMQGTLTA